MTMHLTLFVTLVGGYSIFSVAGERESCITPNGMSGICQNLRKCPSLIKLFPPRGHAIPASTQTLLRQSVCNNEYEAGVPIVCCSGDPPKPFNPETLINSNDCGTSYHGRIFGGNNATLYQFPWMALLKYKTDDGHGYFCGGSLINDRYVLTAAHCITDTLVGVRLGELDLSQDQDCISLPLAEKECAPPPQDFNIEKKIPHTSYSRTTIRNDVALIRLDRTVDLSTSAVQPICLPSKEIDLERDLTGLNMTVAGWGKSENATYGSPLLLFVNVPVMSNSRCSAVYPGLITSANLCAGGSDRKQDSCNGDSGGPLKTFSLMNGSAKYKQYGIVSFGVKDCGRKDHPGVYTRVTSYMDWILKNIAP